MSGNDDYEILRVTRRLISKIRPTKFPGSGDPASIRLRRALLIPAGHRRIDSTFRIPPTSTTATTITDSGFPQVCRVGRTNNLIHHGHRSKAARRSVAIVSTNRIRPSPLRIFETTRKLGTQ